MRPRNRPQPGADSEHRDGSGSASRDSSVSPQTELRNPGPGEVVSSARPAPIPGAHDPQPDQPRSSGPRRAAPGAISTARLAGCTGQLLFRIDSAYYSAAVLGAIRSGGTRFSVTARMDRKIRAAIASHPAGQLDAGDLPAGSLGRGPGPADLRRAGR